MSEKEEIPRRLWDVVTTLTESMQQAAVHKAQELSFDLASGEIPFQETLINLSHDRDVLREAVEKGRIVQIPLKLQSRLLVEATKVKNQLEALVGGSDAIVPFEQAVEDLHATIWQFNLQNLSPELLSFETKMNDLKAQETKIKTLLSEAQKVEQTIQHLSEAQLKAHASLDAALKSAEESKLAFEKIAVLVGNAEEAERTALASVSVIREHQVQIALNAVSAREATAEVTVAKERAEEFVGEIGELHKAYDALKEEMAQLVSSTTEDVELAKQGHEKAFEALDLELRTNVSALVDSSIQRIDATLLSTVKEVRDAIETGTTNYETLDEQARVAETTRDSKVRAQLTEVVSDFNEAKATALSDFKLSVDLLKATAEDNIHKNDSEAKKLTTYLRELEDRINISIERATGYTLFHSFQTRQLELKTSKYLWAVALLACVAASILLSWFFIRSLGTAHEFNPLFVMKLSISLPVIFAITFCSVQYSKERRLEEEYAFKSNISISLEPYQKLVASLVNQGDEQEKAKYTAFIISSINRVFTSPTGLVFDSDDKGGETANSLLKTAGNVAESLMKLKVK
jgi:hypothetical protein